MQRFAFTLTLGLLAAGLCGCGPEPSSNSGEPVAPAGAPAVSSEHAPTNGPDGAAPGTGSSAGAATKLSQGDLDAVAKAESPHKLVLIVKTRNNPFFDPMIKAAEAEAQALGVELEVQSPQQETDKERQFAMVQDVTAKGVAAILVTPADSKGIVPALKQAVDKGVLVINLDNRVDPATAAAAGLELGGYVGADNEAGGEMAGKAMAEALRDTGDVAVLEGIRGADNAEARKRGFQKGLAGQVVTPKIAASDTAEWDTQKAYAKFQSMLAAHPDLKGLFCANDKMALGALKAIRESGRQKPLVVIGYDNIPEVKPYLESGELHATIEQHPDLMGKYGVRMAVGILESKLKHGGEFLVPLDLVKSSKGK